MTALTKTNRVKLRVIVGVIGIWVAVAVGVALWPKFPSGNCPDSPPDTAYVCRVAFGQDFEKASRRRNVLIVLELGVILVSGSLLWLLADRPLRRARPSPVLSGAAAVPPAPPPRQAPSSGQPPAHASPGHSKPSRKLARERRQEEKKAKRAGKSTKHAPAATGTNRPVQSADTESLAPQSAAGTSLEGPAEPEATRK